MKLKTLNGIKSIGEFKVIVMDKLRDQFPDKFNESGAMDYKWFEKEIRPHNFIYIRHDVGSISFTIQDGPVNEVGVNGCQVDEIIHVAKLMLEGLNKNISCRENSIAITKLDEALLWLKKRKEDRINRNVEGYEKP
jgi:hypothetical protein